MIGKESEGARQMNALSKVYSCYFACQSDRTIPGTSFTKGIQVEKLMGKDYRGVLVIILVMVRSTKGRAILNKYRKFKKESDLDDWILLVELMLEWESYLNEPQMSLKHVKRLDKKHRFIMYIMRKVAQRTKGMGLKLVKFHMITHIMDDILQFGVPLEYDTSSNESMHKPSKKASKMTQRAAETFNFQVANRLVEFQLLDLAMVEIETGRVPWDYYRRHTPSKADVDGQEDEIWTGETKILVDKEEDGEVGFRLRTKSKMRPKRPGIRTLSTFCMNCNAWFSLFLPRISCLFSHATNEKDKLSVVIPIIGAKAPGKIGYGLIGELMGGSLVTFGALWSLKTCPQVEMRFILVESPFWTGYLQWWKVVRSWSMMPK